MNLSTRQRAYLRGLGQALRPHLHLGHEGATEATQTVLEDLFRKRELVKIRILKTAGAEPAAVASAMAGVARAAVVGVIGQTFVLYRPNPDLKERIELPPPGPASPAKPLGVSGPRPRDSGLPTRR